MRFLTCRLWVRKRNTFHVLNKKIKTGSRRRTGTPDPLAAPIYGAPIAESLEPATPVVRSQALPRFLAVPGSPEAIPPGDHAPSEPCPQIVSEIHEVADQILHLRRRIRSRFRRLRVVLCAQKLRRTRLRFGRPMGGRITPKPLRVARFDELAHRELPVLLWAGTQAGELFRVHAEGAPSRPAEH